MKMPKTLTLTALTLACVLLFIVSAIIAHIGTMTLWEISTFRYIYNLPQNLRPIMIIITQAGSTWMVVLITVALVYLKKLHIALYVVLTAITTSMLVEFFKVTINRPRPFLLLNNVASRERFITGMGFPSGHTAIATAVSMVLLWYLPKKWRIIVPVWIIMVAFSRIYLGVHAPLDVIGGWALGTVVAGLFFMIRPELSRWSKHLK